MRWAPSRKAVSTKFKIIGLTWLGIKQESTVQQEDALTTRPFKLFSLINTNGEGQQKNKKDFRHKTYWYDSDGISLPTPLPNPITLSSFKIGLGSRQVPSPNDLLDCTSDLDRRERAEFLPKKKFRHKYVQVILSVSAIWCNSNVRRLLILCHGFNSPLESIAFDIFYRVAADSKSAISLRSLLQLLVNIIC